MVTTIIIVHSLPFKNCFERDKKKKIDVLDVRYWRFCVFVYVGYGIGEPRAGSGKQRMLTPGEGV